MKRILILGGGVGGTLTANLCPEALRADRPWRRQRHRGRRSPVSTSTSPASCTSPWAASAPRVSSAPSDRLLDERVRLVVGEVDAHRRGVAARRRSAGGAASGLRQLVLATGCANRPRGDRALRRGGAPLLRPGGCASASATALDAFEGGRIVIGIAGMPYKCPPAPLEVAFLIESELRERGLRERRASCTSARRSGAPSRSRRVSEMATPILAEKGIELHTFFNVETIDRERKVVESLEGEELPYDLLILVPPHAGAVPHRLGTCPGAGRLAADRSAHPPGRRARERLRPGRRDGPAALQGRLDGALRGAGRGRADRRPPSQGRQP